MPSRIVRLSSLERLGSALVAITAAAVVVIALSRASTKLAGPPERFRQFTGEMARSVPELLHRALDTERRETSGLADIVAALPRPTGSEHAAALSIVTTLVQSGRARRAWLVASSGRLIASTGDLLPPTAAPYLEAALRGTAFATGPFPATDGSVVILTGALLPKSSYVLVREVEAGATVGISLPGFSETHSSMRAYLVQRAGDSIVIIAAPSTTATASVVARVPFASAPLLWRRAIGGTTGVTVVTDSGRRTVAFVAPMPELGSTLVQTQLEEEQMGRARAEALREREIGLLLALLLLVIWLSALRIRRLRKLRIVAESDATIATLLASSTEAANAIRSR